MQSTSGGNNEDDLCIENNAIMSLLPPEEALHDILLHSDSSREESETGWKPEMISSCLQNFLENHSSCQVPVNDSIPSSSRAIVTLVGKVVQAFCQIESTTVKRAGRQALEKTASQLLTASNCRTSSLISTLLVVMALSLGKDSPSQTTQSRAIASAICSVLTKEEKKGNGNCESKSRNTAYPFFEALFCKAAPSNDNEGSGDVVDWHIVAGLAKATNVNCLEDEDLSRAVTKVLTRSLELDKFQADDASMTSQENSIPKNQVAGAFALAVQFQPWKAIQTDVLVNLAISYDLWHAAERLCSSAVLQTNESSGPASTAAVDALLEGAFQAKLYRQADTFATKFFYQGGKNRYLEARYLHACGTIAKVICRGALPVVDKQVDRVEKAAKTVESENVETSFYITPLNAVDEIRSFTLQQLEETGNLDSAHRLATMWGVEYIYDEEAILAAAKERKKKYLQWEDLVNGCPPDLISTPEDLVTAMDELIDTSKSKVFGFDAEWSEDDKGADVLQVANWTSVLLIDIKLLSKTPEGVDALEKTVGRLFATPTYTKVGFACRQDISKLRGSPTFKGGMHWLDRVEAVVDLKTVLQISNPALNQLGLSRVCEQFLGKPLDKSEQCSFWNARPLSLRQRIYAALDAWTVVTIHERILAGRKEAEGQPMKRMRADNDT